MESVQVIYTLNTPDGYQISGLIEGMGRDAVLQQLMYLLAPHLEMGAMPIVHDILEWCSNCQQYESILSESTVEQIASDVPTSELN